MKAAVRIQGPATRTHHSQHCNRLSVTGPAGSKKLARDRARPDREHGATPTPGHPAQIRGRTRSGVWANLPPQRTHTPRKHPDARAAPPPQPDPHPRPMRLHPSKGRDLRVKRDNSINQRIQANIEDSRTPNPYPPPSGKIRFL